MACWWACDRRRLLLLLLAGEKRGEREMGREPLAALVRALRPSCRSEMKALLLSGQMASLGADTFIGR